MKAYKGDVVQLHSFLTSALEVGDKSISDSCLFSPLGWLTDYRLGSSPCGPYVPRP
jgi:hypothetical protein